MEQPILSARVQRLKDDMLAEPRRMSVEQAAIIHRVHLSHPNDAPILRRAKALRAAFEEMTIRIEDGELVVGNRTWGVRSGVVFPECGIAWMEDEIDSLPTRPQDPFLTDPADVTFVKEVLLPFWKHRTLESQIDQEIGPLDDAISSVVKINQKGRAQGHIIPDIPKWLRLGPAGLKQEALSRRDTAKTQEERDFYESICIAMEGASTYYGRYAALAEERAMAGGPFAQDEREVAAICRKLASQPPETFHEALQAVWMLMVCLQMESNAASISLGRLDQYLYPFYARDRAAGRLTEEYALELLQCFFLKFNQIVCMRSGLEARYFAGFPIGFNIVLGGRDETGSLLENELSFLMLKTQKALHLPQPNLSARLCAGSSQAFLEACADVLADGGGLPQLFNDESIIPALECSGLSQKDAADYGIVGCVELAGCGNMLGWSNATMFNVVKVLELTLNHGRCLLTGQMLAPDLGGLDTYNSYIEVEDALRQHMAYFIERMVRCHNVVDRYHGVCLPTAFLSSVVDGCMERGVDVTCGGARYNSSGVQFVQIANLIDSLTVLRDLVFTGKLPGPVLLEQLRQNFPDSAIRRQVLEAPKYGNDLPQTDILANQWVRFMADELEQYRKCRGGRFHLGLYTVSAHVPMGANVGASCDGRLAGQPLADGGISPSSGSDRLGPTAVLKSASSLEFQRISNGSLLNMKFSSSMFQEAGSRARFCALLRSFVALGIHHVQFNVVSRDELLAAQREPGKHRNLLIRVAGYTAYFVELDRTLQDEIIRRTECVL